MAGKEASFTVASVQATPVVLDRDRTIDKACTLVADAAKNGAKIIVFPEAFVPTYPDWIWVLPPAQAALHRELYGELLDQSVAVPSPATEKLGKAAKAAGAYVVIGVNERNVEASGSSIYNTLLYFGPDGKLLGKHRKLMPTSAERLVWAAGAGDTLEVYDTPYGKLGGLICWENYMPLARYAMYAWGTQIYVAPTWDSSVDGWVPLLQHIAREGRVAVIGCCMALRHDDIPDGYKFKASYPAAGDGWVNQGASTIVAPYGPILAGPALKEETILYAELDPAVFRQARLTFDPAGHYGRPDVFQLTVNREANPMITTTGTANGLNTVDGPQIARAANRRTKETT
jgi:nitrilase